MRSQQGLGRKWRRFKRKHGLRIATVLLVSALLVLVALLMYALTSVNWGT
jgi:hypothetical protein